MAELLGSVVVNKRIRKHAVWQRMDYGFCWVDMLLLANDRPRTAFANGTAYQLKRGQLLWSKQSLSKEWRKSSEWLDAFLKLCQDEEMITVDSDRRRTIITILNYDAYNPFTTSEPETEPVTDTASEPEQKVEGGKEKRKVEATALRPPGEKEPRNLTAFGSGNFKKNAAAGMTPAQARYELGRELEHVSERLDAAAELGMPPDPADKKREKELKGQLAALSS